MKHRYEVFVGPMPADFVYFSTGFANLVNPVDASLAGRLRISSVLAYPPPGTYVGDAQLDPYK